jgi:hypothetical protein
VPEALRYIADNCFSKPVVGKDPEASKWRNTVLWTEKVLLMMLVLLLLLLMMLALLSFLLLLLLAMANCAVCSLRQQRAHACRVMQFSMSMSIPHH